MSVDESVSPAMTWTRGDRLVVRYDEQFRAGHPAFPAVRHIEVMYEDEVVAGAFYGSDAETGQVHWLFPDDMATAGVTVSRWTPGVGRRGGWPQLKGIDEKTRLRAKEIGMRL